MKYPDKINVECSTACNARCTFCTRYTLTRKHGQMEDELFKKIVREGKEMGVMRYSPFLMGEPFFFPRIWEWLDFMRDEGVRAAMYTNGIYVDVDRLAEYDNIDYLNFSINAATPETHKRIMRGPNFKIAKKNYDYAREKLTIPVRASFVVVEDNAHEVERFREMFPSHEVTGFANWTGDREDKLARRGERVPCWVLFHQMTILYDGTVVPCCMDSDGKQVFGDARVQHLKEIWENAEWMREKHRNYEFDTYVCRDCNYNVKNKYYEGPDNNISNSK